MRFTYKYQANKIPNMTRPSDSSIRCNSPRRELAPFSGSIRASCGTATTVERKLIKWLLPPNISGQLTHPPTMESAAKITSGTSIDFGDS